MFNGLVVDLYSSCQRSHVGLEEPKRVKEASKNGVAEDSKQDGGAADGDQEERMVEELVQQAAEQTL